LPDSMKQRPSGRPKIADFLVVVPADAITEHGAASGDRIINAAIAIVLDPGQPALGRIAVLGLRQIKQNTQSLIAGKGFVLPQITGISARGTPEASVGI